MAKEMLSTTKQGPDVQIQDDADSDVEFLRALGSQSGVSVWQHTLVG